ncbi:hypothetical protein DSL72_001109 [Monilinia vaccinii-corymbosi]|uniref:Uncharacterized protein n=1 Tax=Monilinia vaccinii-corymbosi TaxID=61207 RepID=A0A8A3P366_9HELO|nr:hypothetical protein DSL72_001109 [Monilinia vaccinii-corymbosi]
MLDAGHQGRQIVARS